jgi:starch synthase
MEFHGKLNLLKTGMVFADSIVTVSPRYAQEIQSSPLGCGLEGVTQHRRDVLSGILNGIDDADWNPATDRHLPAQYDATTVSLGKAACKAALQKELGLPQAAGVPLVATVGRLDDQKGFDLIAELLQRWVQTSDVQWVVLGTGQPKYHKLFEGLAQRYPHKIAARLEFSNPLAHRIEAGSDMFLMPSRFEPCGLNQMYSLKYGTVPIIRETGGLADTIVGYGSPQEYSPLALSETLRRACDLFRLHPDEWKALIDTGMRQDWSWTQSAKKYVDLYLKTATRAGIGATK